MTPEPLPFGMGAFALLMSALMWWQYHGMNEDERFAFIAASLGAPVLLPVAGVVYIVLSFWAKL